jgi:hypothetical protein
VSERKKDLVEGGEDMEAQVALTAMTLNATARSGVTEECVVDTGASRHMYGNRRNFRELTRLPPEECLKVKFGDGGTRDAEYEGTIELQTTRPEEPRLKKALYVPGASTNLLSVRQAESSGAKAVFEAGKGSLMVSGRVVATAESAREGDIYKFRAAPLRIDAAVAGVQTAAERWHQRFCHLGFGNMTRLVREDMVKAFQ